MRVSILKVATVALLGLGNAFSGILAAPTSNDVIEYRSVTDRLVARAKDVPNIEEKDYIIQETGFPIGDNSHDKAYLSDIAMYVFHKKGEKKPEDLERVRFEVIVENNTQPAIEAAFWEKKSEEDFTVKNNDHGDKKAVFDSLSQTTFGKMAARYHDDYNCGKIKTIKVSGAITQPDMELELE